VAVFVLTYLSPENPGNGLLNKGMGAACLVVGALLVEVSLPRPGALAPRRNLLRLGMWLGSISYPLYLVHFAIAERIVRRLCSFFLSWNPEGVVRVFILIAVSLALAAVVQRFVETRFLDLGRLLIRALHRRTRISPSP
jgi:peptidoglycan/LPS O-acetylase OafA/YrhL